SEFARFGSSAREAGTRISRTPNCTSKHPARVFSIPGDSLSARAPQSRLSILTHLEHGTGGGNLFQQAAHNKVGAGGPALRMETKMHVFICIRPRMASRSRASWCGLEVQRMRLFTLLESNGLGGDPAGEGGGRNAVGSRKRECRTALTAGSRA